MSGQVDSAAPYEELGAAPVKDNTRRNRLILLALIGLVAIAVIVTVAVVVSGASRDDEGLSASSGRASLSSKDPQCFSSNRKSKNCLNSQHRDSGCCGAGRQCRLSNQWWGECFASEAECKQQGWPCNAPPGGFVNGGSNTNTNTNSGNTCSSKNCVTKANGNGGKGLTDGCCASNEQCRISNGWYGECFKSESDCKKNGWSCQVAPLAGGSNDNNDNNNNNNDNNNNNNNSGFWGISVSNGPSKASLKSLSDKFGRSRTWDIRSTNKSPKDRGHLPSAARTECRVSHYNYDDPIVFPGKPDATHLHMFWGNGETSYRTTAGNIRNAKSATCRGGLANLSGYWAPALIDENGNPVAPFDIFTYYKSALGYVNSGPHNVYHKFPKNLKMVVGQPSHVPASSGENTNTRIKHGSQQIPRYRLSNWYCRNAGTHNWNANPTIPTNCRRGQELGLEIHFPSCWDGRSDSNDHRSHVIFPDPNTGCRNFPQHNREIPTIQFTIVWRVGSQDTSKWRLSSDRYTRHGQQGASAHGDWFEGWDDDIADAMLQNCIRGGKECGASHIGGGREMFFGNGLSEN